ncbi:MAG: asparaginase [Flavobacteriales bacterium]|nr:asparaginase [Flavobacteriales bacterium]
MDSIPSILIIYTGGTIGMARDAESGSYKAFEMDALFRHFPELEGCQAKLSTWSFEEPLDSSDIDISIWVKLAHVIHERYNDFDGFVVLHGTDTMAYTASALSFMLQDLAKPVIITGSQLPVGVLRTDGKENLIGAIEIASAKWRGHARVPEVAIYFGSSLYRGNRAQKFNTEGFEAFASFNHPPLVEVGIHMVFRDDVILRPVDGDLQMCDKMEPNVGVLRFFPGISEAFVRQVLSTPGLKGLVLETYGSGNVPTRTWLRDALVEAAEQGMMLVNVTQCDKGFVEQGRYQTSQMLRDAGVISGADMTVEAALTKMMKLLGNGYAGDELEAEFRRSWRGELTAYSILA